MCKLLNFWSRFSYSKICDNNFILVKKKRNASEHKIIQIKYKKKQKERIENKKELKQK